MSKPSAPLPQMVLDGGCSIGITGTLPFNPPGITAESLSERTVTVVAVSSPLATAKGRVKLRDVQEETQLVLSDRSSLTKGVDYGGLPTSAQSMRFFGQDWVEVICRCGWWRTTSLAVASSRSNLKVLPLASCPSRRFTRRDRCRAPQVDGLLAGLRKRRFRATCDEANTLGDAHSHALLGLTGNSAGDRRDSGGMGPRRRYLSAGRH
jgi:hypothetical protein